MAFLALEDKFNSEHQENAPSKDELSIFENQINELFKQVQTEYMNRMKNYYTNWNSGYTKNNKQKTLILNLMQKLLSLDRTLSL